MVEFVRLSCPNCGAKLDIYGDDGHLACSFCGSEVAVIRRGSSVSLRLVTEAIQRVQEGTDKTAAELAINRYTADLQRCRGEQSTILAVKDERGGCAVWLGVPLAMFGVMALVNGKSEGVCIGLGLLGLGGAIFAWPFVGGEGDDKLKELQQLERDLLARITEKKEVADD